MSLPIGTILNVISLQENSFSEQIPYRGLYINTFMDTEIELEPGWISLSPRSPLLKIFTDNDTMKQNVKNTAHAENMTVETLLELSDRLDDLEQEVTELKDRAITNAEDFITKQSTFWYSKETPGTGSPIELVIPSYSTIRFKSTYEVDRSADLIITRNRSSNSLWKITTPMMSVARVEDNNSLPEDSLPTSQRKIIGNIISCKGRFMNYNSTLKQDVDILSYTNEQGENIPIPYPLGDNAIFNDVEIRDQHTLYLSDPNARIKIRKPKEI